MSDDESQIRNLRLSLENWKEIVLLTNNILLWEKQWHSTAILGGSTVFFMFMWLLDPSILTVFSLAGLTITICDFVLPSILSSVFKSEVWTNQKQKQLEDICTQVILYKTKCELLCTSYYKLKHTNPKAYYSLTIIALSLLAWIGSTINNLFLTYVTVTFLLLLPGMGENGMLNKWTSGLQKVFNDLVENAKSKVNKKHQ